MWRDRYSRAMVVLEFEEYAPQEVGCRHHEGGVDDVRNHGTHVILKLERSKSSMRAILAFSRTNIGRLYAA